MEKTKKNWAFIFSPCIVAMIIAAGIFIYEYVMIEDRELQGYLGAAVILSLPCLFVTLVIDIHIRLFLFLKNVKRKALYIWIIESVVIVLTYGFLDRLSHLY